MNRAKAVDWLLLLLPILATWLLAAELDGFPSNDDPFYGRTAKSLAESGRLIIYRQNGELTASSVLHGVIGGLVCRILGFSYRHLFLAVLLQIWVGGIALYEMSRRVGASRSMGLLMAATFLFTPYVFGHAFTFMTDGPAVAWFIVAIYAFHRALERDSWRWWWLGAIVAAGVFWIRQTHVLVIAFPLFAQGVHSLRCKGRLQLSKGSIIAIAVVVLAALLFESELFTRSNLKRLDDAAPRPFDLQRLREVLIAVYGLALLMGFVLLPLLAPACEAVLRQVRRAWGLRTWTGIGVGGMVVVLLLIPFLMTGGQACLTNATGMFVQNAHLGPVYLSDSYERHRWDDMGGVEWPRLVWQMLTACSICSFGVFSSLVWNCLMGGDSASEAENRNSAPVIASPTEGRASVQAQVIGLLCLIPLFACLLVMLISGILDRYWLPAIAAMMVSVVLLTSRSLSATSLLSRGVSTASLMAVLGLSVLLVHDFLAWNQLRWRQTEQWLAQGLHAQDFDGGRDINAWYRAGEDSDTRPRPGDSTYFWSGYATWSLSTHPREGWEEVDRLRWTSWATCSEHHVLVLRKNSAMERESNAGG